MEKLDRAGYHVIRNGGNPGEYWHGVTSRYGYWVATPGQVTLYARELYADGTWVQELPAGGEWVLWSDVVEGGEWVPASVEIGGADSVG